MRVRICLSSLSLLQKLFHTSSPEGKTYPPEIWHSKLGLPGQHDLTGLDLEVKSIFFLYVNGSDCVAVSIVEETADYAALCVQALQRLASKVRDNR